MQPTRRTRSCCRPEWQSRFSDYSGGCRRRLCGLEPQPRQQRPALRRRRSEPILQVDLAVAPPFSSCGFSLLYTIASRLVLFVHMLDHPLRPPFPQILAPAQHGQEAAALCAVRGNEEEKGPAEGALQRRPGAVWKRALHPLTEGVVVIVFV